VLCFGLALLGFWWVWPRLGRSEVVPVETRKRTFRTEIARATPMLGEYEMDPAGVFLIVSLGDNLVRMRPCRVVAEPEHLEDAGLYIVCRTWTVHVAVLAVVSVFTTAVSAGFSGIGEPANAPPSTLVADLGSSEFAGDFNIVVPIDGREPAALFSLLL
jgi:hypothetical protein